MNNFLSRSVYKSELLGESYEKFTHPCGLDIYVFKKEFSSTYAILGVKYGSVHNSFSVGEDGEISVPDGIAHFLEHKLFTNEDGSDSFERFSEYGADANAYTSFNKTAYLFSCTDNFEPCLAELIDFVTHPYFTPESVASEIGIISEEIKMYDDSPSDKCFYGMLEGMYEHHPIKRNICGSEKSIRSISAKTLYDCYNRFYNPKNMALIVCGNVNTDEVLKIANGHLPKVSHAFDICVKDDNAIESPYAFKNYVEQKMQVSKPLFNIGIKDTDIPKSPLERQKKDAAMAILDEMIFSRAGELYNSLFEKELISPNMSYGYTISSASAYNSLAGEADDPREVLDEIFKYISTLQEKGLSQKDFLRGKRVMYSEFVKSFDSTDNIANNMLSFICEDSELLSYADIIESVTFDDVNKLFKTMFEREKVTLSVIKPLNKNQGEKI